MENERTAYFLKDGEPYDGRVFEDDKGKPFGEISNPCGRCGGSGRWRRKLKCFGCEGAGVKHEQVRIYDSVSLSRFQAGRDKRVEAKVRKEMERQEQLEIRFREFRTAHLEIFEIAEAMRGHKFVQNILAKAREWGGLTDRQLASLTEIAKENKASRAILSASAAIGQPGERLDIEVMCRGRGSFRRKAFKGRRMEEVFITQMVDRAGNAYMSMTPAFSLEPGECAHVRGTVKNHDDSNGWSTTVLGNIFVVERKIAPFPITSLMVTSACQPNKADADDEFENPTHARDTVMDSSDGNDPEDDFQANESSYGL